LDYGYGDSGLSVDHAKCIELLRQSACLGFPEAQYQLGIFHRKGEMGLKQNEEEVFKYFKGAAEGGHVLARNHLGCMEVNNGNIVAAMRHWRLSASEGYRDSTTNLVSCFEAGLLHHGDLAESLRAFYRSRAEMSSADRDRYIEHLKESGRGVSEWHAI
jgi:TPR repeat protein